MPPASATRPIRPSSASTSRTRWPLPRPPTAGLQDIAPMVEKRWVTSAVFAPMRAAAAAASQPACPPPMTMTSKLFVVSLIPNLYPERRKVSRETGATQSHSVSRETPPGAGLVVSRETTGSGNLPLTLTRINHSYGRGPHPTASLPYTELAKNHVENILDIDPPKEPAERMSRGPQFLRHELLTLPRNIQGPL